MRKRLGGRRNTTEKSAGKRENDAGFLSGKFSEIKTLSQFAAEQKERQRKELEPKSQLAIKYETPSPDDSRNSEDQNSDSDVINYKDLGFIEMPTLSKISPKSDSDQ